MKLQEIWIENYGSFAGEHRFQLSRSLHGVLCTEAAATLGRLGR